MPYQIQKFDEIPLPVYNPVQDHSPASSITSFVDSIGGYFDLFGGDSAQAQRQIISLSGLLVGEVETLVDELGDEIVDDLGDELVTAESEAADLRSQVESLRARVRSRGQLWRVLLEDETVRQWKTARFVRMSQPQVASDRAFKVSLTCEFETAMTYWHAEDATTSSGSATSGAPLALVVDNGGETVEDAVLTVTRTSGTITAVAVVCTSLGLSWTWTGSLTAGDVLVVDAGLQTVEENGAGVYSGFALSSSHSASKWLTITPGPHLMYVTTTGGNATVSLSFYHQVA